MMLKITERCTMGCKHCMNDAKPDGKDMTLDVFKDSLEFLQKNGLCKMLIITGGEPTEHKNFDDIMNCLFDFQERFNYFVIIVITTNGEVISKEPERFKEYVKRAYNIGFRLMFQVSADVRYYPRRIQTHKRIFREDGFELCDDCVEHIYPQGRALENNIPWESKASKCYNVRALSKQLDKYSTLRDIEGILSSSLKFCTPHIKVNGDIGLGESDLCPSCTSIYESMENIMNSIREFKCDMCNHINNKLSSEYKKFL